MPAFNNTRLSGPAVALAGSLRRASPALDRALRTLLTSPNPLEFQKRLYFFATGWVDRSLAAVSRAETKMKIDRWWGCGDWQKLIGMEGNARAKMVARRFEQELGYRKAVVYPIHSQRRGGRVMYHMIHATDHPEAFPLMVRAYRKVSGRADLEATEQQLDFEALLREIQKDDSV
jgi:hypothetical protein